MRPHIAFALAALVVGCGSAAPGSPPQPQSSVDMASASPAYCGTRGKSAILLSSCNNGCVPDEQVFFLCTEKLGRIAYTRQALYKTQQFGYSLELDDARACGDTPVKIWTLTPLQGLTNASVGKMTPSAVDSDACFGYVKQAAYIESNLDRLYYSVAEVSQ